MFSINRIFAAILIVFAGLWIWATIVFQRQVAADNIFQATQVTPSIEKTLQQSKDFQQALKDREQGKVTPLPTFEPHDTHLLDESIKRMKLRSHYRSLQYAAQLGFLATAFAWTIGMQIQLAVRKRRWESPDRPASENAGKVIGDLMRGEQLFVARSSDAYSPRVVEVDGGRALVTFKNFSFIVAFVGNPTRERVEIPFPDLLAASISYAKGHPYLQLRTTQGKVVISEKVQPFPELFNILNDIVELNRTSPSQYRAALAREPVVRTPWYGWLAIAAAVGAMGIAFWWFVFRNG